MNLDEMPQSRLVTPQRRIDSSDLDPISHMLSASVGQHETATKRYPDRFNRFCRAHERDQQTDRQTDTQTDWLRDRPHYFMCSNGPLSLANVAMPPKIMYLPFIFGPIPNLLTCEILTMLTDDAYQRWFNDDRGIQTLLLMLLLRPLHCHPSSSQLNASIIVSERFRRKWL